MFLYLHGFASGPGSTKARFFQEKLTAHGIAPAIPDLNTPSFREMTVTTQVELVTRLLDAGEQPPNVLIGSSMGGLVATLAATQRADVDALVLMAPGFGIEKRWSSLVDDSQRVEWQRNGETLIFHWAENGQQALNYAFVEDLESRDTRELPIDVPTIVFHGTRDDVVPLEESLGFARHNADVELLQLDDGHDLLASLEAIWEGTLDFLRRNELLQ